MHAVTLPEALVAQLVAQRGRAHRYERLDAARTALVVIDLQNVFMLPGMPIEVPQARAIVPNVNRLAAALRAAGGLVAWVQMTLAGEAERWSVFFDSDRRREALAHLTPGAAGHDLHDGCDVRAQDLVVAKRRYSAFVEGSSDLHAELRRRNIDTLVIVGTLTNVCCESTARDAMMLNYRVVLVSDANAALTDEEHLATLCTVARVFGDVATADEVLGRLVPADAAGAAAG